MRTLLLSLIIGVTKLMAGIFNPAVHTLSNGMQVILIPNGVTEIVDINLLVKVGCADDPVEQFGMSHFLEHMMFTGTNNIPSDKFKKIIRKLGGYSNAFTSYDYTVYQNKVSSKHIETVLSMESDRLENLNFSEEEIAREKNIVMEERRKRLENHQFGNVIESYLRAMHLYHPYGLPSIGYPHHIEAYDYKSTKEHYNKWYAPNNSILIICGKFDEKKVFELVKKYFGSLIKKDIPKRIRSQDPMQRGITKRIIEKNPRNSLFIFLTQYSAPHHKNKDSKLFYSTIVLSYILGGNETTHFHKHFVEDKKLTLSISSEFNEYTYDPTTFGISATMAPKVTIAQFEKELNLYIKNIIQNGIDAKEVERAKRDIVSNLLFIKDGNGHAIDIYLGLACGFTIEEIENMEKYINEVSVQDVNLAVKTIFENLPIVSMELYPEKTL